MGIFFAVRLRLYPQNVGLLANQVCTVQACLLGPAIAPPTGGFVAYYWSWRAMQMSMFVTAILAFAVIYMCLPETSQPNARGIDKLNEGLPIEEQRWRFTLLNPFANLVLLRSPVVLSTVCATLIETCEMKAESVDIVSHRHFHPHDGLPDSEPAVVYHSERIHSAFALYSQFADENTPSGRSLWHSQRSLNRAILCPSRSRQSQYVPHSSWSMHI